MPNLSEAFQRKTILVTGGAGAIGTNLVRVLDAFEPKKIVIPACKHFDAYLPPWIGYPRGKKHAKA